MAKPRSASPSVPARRPVGGQRTDGRRTAGFTLLEVLVATALMATAVIGLMALVNQSMRNATPIRQYDRAAMLARSQMNELLTMEPAPIGQSLSGTFDDEAGWRARVEPFNSMFEPVPGRSILARTVLTVWWRDAGRERSIEVEGFRRVRVTPDMDLSGLSAGGGEIDPRRLF